MDTIAEGRARVASRSEWVPWVVLALGVIAASVSAILIRYASDAQPLAISFWRCAAGAVILLPFARWKRRGMDTHHFKISAVAGFFLALHFATWITSVNLTTVAESVLLVSTTPVFVALAARLLFNERLPAVVWIGIAIAMAGTGLVGLAGGTEGQSSLFGNSLALLGGATVAGYALGGAAARRRLGIIEYAVVAYASSAVFLLAASLAAGAALSGYGPQTWWAIAGLTVGPQLLGHTLINFVLKDIDATTVSVTIMAEPVIASLLAFSLFGEVPSLIAIPGGVAILAGIYVVSTARRTREIVVE